MRRVTGLATVILLGLVVTLAVAAPVKDDSAAPLRDRIFERFVAGNYADAARLIEEHLKSHPGDADMLYNAACAYSRLGQRDKAAEYLLRAVEAGFREFDHMRADADLAAIRDHETYQAILEALDRLAVERQARRPEAPRGEPASTPKESALDQWRRQYGDQHYRYDRDPAHHLAFAISLDDVSFAEMRLMLRRECDHLIKTLFDGPPNAEVLIAIPTPEDADELLKEQRVGGSYIPDARRLISRNIGGNLRHEFVHVLHHAQMERIGQVHPLWIQEGIATLYEDYELADDGTIRFLPNERHNVVKRLASEKHLVAWPTLLSMSDEAFMADASNLYPQVRSIFQFVAARGKLSAWYRSYVERFAEDASGRKATEDVFGASLDDVQRQWKVWLAGQPALDLAIDGDGAALGVELSQEVASDGVAIERVLPGSGAAAAGLQSGDVIVAINGRPTRSTAELLSIIGPRRVGDELTVRLRRGDRYQAAQVTLRRLRVR